MRGSLLPFLAPRSMLALIACMTAGVTAGCGSDPNPEERSRLAESLAAWEEIKAGDDGAYAYTRTYDTWFGVRFYNLFVVQDDVVVRRVYEKYEEYEEGDRLTDSYDEQGDEVGSHVEGSPAYTIDELYEVCRDEVLAQDPDDNRIILEFHPDGILAHCRYAPRNCVDDCSKGVDIESLDLNATL
jgi:hypothetical protein